MKLKPKIIFMGTPEFGAIILDGLIKGGYPPVLVITVPDKPVGRKQILTSPPVKVLAEKYKIPVLQPEKIENIKEEIRKINPQLIILTAYKEILSKEILDIPRYGSLNIHPSLLPRWRGPSPIQFTILNGDNKTGVTIIKMTEKVDAGPILAQEEIELRGKETYLDLENKLRKVGKELLVRTIPDWLEKKIKPQPQNEKEATYSKILTREDGKINWENPAEVIERQIRAFHPWLGSYTFWQKNEKLIKIKILKVRILKTTDKTKYSLGKTLAAPQNELCVQTGNGFLVIEKLQMEGRKEMNSEEFLRGQPDFIGTVLK